MSGNQKGSLKKDTDNEEKKEKKVKIIDDRKSLDSNPVTAKSNKSLDSSSEIRSSEKKLSQTPDNNSELKQNSKASDNNYTSLTKDQLINKIGDLQNKIKNDKDSLNQIILRQSDEIDDKDNIIGSLSNQNKKLIKLLEQLKDDVDSKLDKVETKKLAEKIKDIKKDSTLEQILINKDKELKNAYKLMDILQKDKNDLTKNLTEKSDYSSVVSLEDKVKFLEKKLYEANSEIKLFKSVCEEHKFCLNYKSTIEKNRKEFHDEIILLKNKNKEMFMRWKDEEIKLDKINDSYFYLRREYDDLRHSLGQKFLNNQNSKDQNIFSSKDNKFKESLDKDKKIEITNDQNKNATIDNKKSLQSENLNKEMIQKSSINNKQESKKTEDKSIDIDKKNEKKKEDKTENSKVTSNDKKKEDKTDTSKLGSNDKKKEDIKEVNDDKKSKNDELISKDVKNPTKSNNVHEEKKLLFTNKSKDKNDSSEYKNTNEKHESSTNNYSEFSSDQGNKKILSSKYKNNLPDINKSLTSLNQKHFSIKIKDYDEDTKNLFSENERLDLLKVVSKDNVEIFEKRFEALDHSKFSLEQKYKSEAKKLQKRISQLENQLQLVELTLKESEKKIKILHYQIIEHRNENKIIIKKNHEYTKQIEIFNIIIREKDQENKFLFSQLQNMQHTLAISRKNMSNQENLPMKQDLTEEVLKKVEKEDDN